MKASPAQPNRRVVAVVGRPNVGKSALFNRLVGRRLAIVHEESGVTRDRLASEARWGEARFELIDTGGVGLIDTSASPDAIEQGTREQVGVAIEDAAVVILVTDLTAGVVPLDVEVARLLHESNRPVFLAANKADTEALDANAGLFEELGFPVFPVSALHNRGLGPLMEQVVDRLPETENITLAAPLKVAIVGRPNVGKSSYINRLLRNERVIVSEVPGTTRDSIEIPFVVGKGAGARHYVLIDTAGIRKQGRVKSAVDQFSLVRTRKSIARADVVVLMLDAQAGPTARDKRIAAHIIEEKKGCLLLVNKWDLAEEVTQRAFGRALREAVPFLHFVPTLFASAKSGYNIRKTIEAIDYVGAQVQTALSTGLLNRLLRDAVQRVAPPAKGGRRLKIYYATQVGIKPVRVRLFVNDPKRITASYRVYLDKALRKGFGLEGAPLVLQFRTRTRRGRVGSGPANR